MKKLLVLAIMLSLTSCGGGFVASKRGQNNNAQQAALNNSLAYLEVPKNAEYILTTSHDHNTDGYNHLASLVFKAAVESKSNGKIGVKIYPNGQLAASGKEGITGLINGTLDIFKVTGDLATVWPPAAVFDIPYIFPNDRVAEAVYGDTQFIDLLRKEILSIQPEMRLIMVASSGGWRSFATTKKQVKSPSNLQGLKIRTVPAKIQQDLVNSLGGAPTAMPYSEVYTSLSTGVVDGANLSIVDIVNAKLHESLKYYILDNHSYLVAFWFMNSAKLKSLPPDLRVIVADSFEDMRNWLNTYPKLAQVSAYETFHKAGGTIYTPTAEELAQFKVLTQHFQKELVAENPELKPILDALNRSIALHQQRISNTRNLEIN